MKQKKRWFIVCVSFIFLFSLNFISATTICDTSLISLNNNQMSQTIRCSNSNNSTLVFVSSNLNILAISPSYISPSDNPFINIVVLPGTSVGNYNGQISFSDNSPTIPINVSITSTETQNPTGCDLEIFPTTLQNVKIQQGETKTRTIMLTVPQCFSSSVSINGVILSTDEKPITLGELSLGTLQPGNSINIPIVIDATGVTTGQYSDTLSFSLYNSSGMKIIVPSVSVSVMVTSGITPLNNFSLSQLPSCSLSAVQMSLNSTYKMTCTNTNPNIAIFPIIDSTIINGVSVTPSSNQYIYEFKPIQIGTTTVGAKFIYQNGEIGSGFQQEVRITYSGGDVLPGTQLKFEFNPILSLASDGQDIVVHAVDSKTNSYVDNAQIYLDGVLINGTIKLTTNKNYTLRAHVTSGYVDYNETISINPKYITITLNPASGIVENKALTITTLPENCSLFLDGTKISNTIFPSMGNHTIEAIKEGYVNTQLNFFADQSVNLISFANLTKGSEAVFILNKDNLAWQVVYLKNFSASPETITAGTGKTISFTPTKKGIYRILVDGEQKWQGELTGGWDGKIFGFAWYYLVIAIVVIVIVIFIILKFKGGSSRGYSYLPRSMAGIGEVTSEV